MSIKSRISAIKSQIHNELDIAQDLLGKFDYSTQFGQLISTVTRIKLLEDLIRCFVLIKKDKQNEIRHLIDRVRKRIKLHLHQIYKLESITEGYQLNKLFFYDCLRVLLNFMYEKIKLNGIPIKPN